MVLLTFADNSTRDIPLEELQLIPYFKDMPNLTEDSQKLDLSFNKRFTYGNIIRCIAFSDSVNDSCKELMNYFCIDTEYYDKKIVKEAFKINLKGIERIDFNAIILRCQIDNKCLIDNYERIFKLPINIIKKCITKENVNIQNNNNFTALIYASLGGQIKIINLLIEAGANINLQSKYNSTALMFASERGYTKIVKLLIKAGANVNLQNYDDNTALMLASEEGHTKIVELLSEADAN